MNKLRLYSVSDEYIRFLREDPKLFHVFDNKENARKHTRKYLGIALEIKGFSYYIPLSSPKQKDYEFVNGEITIKNSTPTIVRIVSVNNVSHKPELKGTLKINCMIPVPFSELTPYDINSEKDLSYKIVVQKEYKFISKNTKMICSNANLVYNQKMQEQEAIRIGKKYSAPEYLKTVIPFDYAEIKADEFISKKDKLPL